MQSALTLPDEIEELIPLDKSWMIRLGVLDLLHGYDDMERFLEAEESLNTDLQALLRASRQWRKGERIDVGESGTLYRFLQFAAWKRGENRLLIRSGTLKGRAVTRDPTIVHMPLTELLKLDNGTSQWASAAVLLGNNEAPPKPTPYKLQITYDAVEHWKRARAKGKRWEARRDLTIMRQAAAYLHWLQTGVMIFEPEQAEDYCLARAFGLMTPEQGEAKWPSLRQHESDRIASMEEALGQQTVYSTDHRVVQAVAMFKGQSVHYAYPQAVNKSWPLFWDLIK